MQLEDHYKPVASFWLDAADTSPYIIGIGGFMGFDKMLTPDGNYWSGMRCFWRIDPATGVLETPLLIGNHRSSSW